MNPPGQPGMNPPGQPGMGQPGAPAVGQPDRDEQTRQRAAALLAPGEPLTGLAWCTKGFVDYRTDHGAWLAGLVRPSNLAAELIGGAAAPDPGEYRRAVNPSSGGPPNGAGPRLDATLPEDWKPVVVAVTPARVLVLAPAPRPAEPVADRLRTAGRSLLRGVRDFVVNKAEVQPVPPLAVRWSCPRGEIHHAVPGPPSQAGFPRTVLVFQDGTWCALSPCDPLNQHRLLTALTP